MSVVVDVVVDVVVEVTVVELDFMSKSKCPALY